MFPFSRYFFKIDRYPYNIIKSYKKNKILTLQISITFFLNYFLYSKNLSKNNDSFITIRFIL